MLVAVMGLFCIIGGLIARDIEIIILGLLLINLVKE
jgi:hypothetical protein